MENIKKVLDNKIEARSTKYDHYINHRYDMNAIYDQDNSICAFMAPLINKRLINNLSD